MIHVLLTRANATTISHYLETWGRDVRGFVRPRSYEDLAFGGALTPGTYLFSDLERLTPAQNDLATFVWRRLAERPDSFRALNDPSAALRRFDLLKRLHADGINNFQAHRLTSGTMPETFPLFLRRESEHDGAISEVIRSPDELKRAVDDALAKGVRREDLLAVEYCNTADETGLFRKYAAFRVGERMIPRHVLFSRNWVVKLADATEGAHCEEEQAYLKRNPHDAELRRIFDLAHIDYGRIDYSMLPDGRMQVWEINTNPTISVAPHKLAPERLVSQQTFMKQLKSAWEAIDRPGAGKPLKLRVPAELSRRLNVGPMQRLRRTLARGVKWLSRQSFVTEYP
jgi:hypothetical protein